MIGFYLFSRSFSNNSNITGNSGIVRYDVVSWSDFPGLIISITLAILHSCCTYYSLSEALIRSMILINAFFENSVNL